LLATVNVFYRDTQHILGVLIQALFFLTPVFYSATDVPQQVLFHGLMLYPRRWLYWVNPMASIISAYRDLLYFGAPTAWDFLMRTALTALVIFILGYLVFLHYSPRFGEEV
jgi:ABC-type polysaccharide/polyol phosphate export permease